MRAANDGPRRATRANLRKRSSKQTLASLRCRPRSIGCYQAIRPVPTPVPAWPSIARAFHANAIKADEAVAEAGRAGAWAGTFKPPWVQKGQTYCCTNEFPRQFALKDLLVAHKMRPGWP